MGKDASGAPSSQHQKYRNCGLTSLGPQSVCTFCQAKCPQKFLSSLGNNRDNLDLSLLFLLHPQRCCLPAGRPLEMSQKIGVTVKDVPAQEFVQAYAQHLKRSGKIRVPKWADLVKTATYKELSPYDPDWYYIRAGTSSLCPSCPRAEADRRPLSL